MKFASRCLPTGKLPYENVGAATRMMAKLFENMPYIPVLPKVSAEDTILKRTVSNIPGFCIDDKGHLIIKKDRDFEGKFARLERAFSKPSKETLDEFGFDAVFLEKFLQMLKKFKSPQACVNLIGPFSISQMIVTDYPLPLLTDKSYLKLFIDAVCVKAFWIIEKIKEYSPETVPIIMLEEPILGRFGEIKRQDESITVEVVTRLFSRTIEKIKTAGADVGIQCLDKCNWQIPINAGVDLITFDAYNNPNNLNIIPDTVADFISRGGKINWGIVPTMTEAIVKSLNIEYLKKRLFTTLDGLVMAGVPSTFVYNSAVVSPQGDLDHLPLIFAEKALILTSQLSKKIPVLS